MSAARIRRDPGGGHSGPTGRSHWAAPRPRPAGNAARAVCAQERELIMAVTNRIQQLSVRERAYLWAHESVWRKGLTSAV